MAAKVKKNGRPVKTHSKYQTSSGTSKGLVSSERTDKDSRGNRAGIWKWLPFLSARNFVFFSLAITFGALQCYHISTMFEKDRFFSHLSDLEREMSFRSEMGLYFSYYKDMTEAPSISEGFNSAMHDKIVEYPSTVNALKRFNIYPEMFLGILKREYESFMRYMNKPTKMCYTVKRGRGLSHVQNCEGMGDIAIFYINCIFFWNGVMMSLFFVLAVVLSGSIFGGIIAVAGFFYNHGECTRVQWTPPLRESMAYPFFVLQLLAVTYTLRIPRPRWIHSAFIMIPSLFFILCWQFAQFTLLTQMLSIFATFVLGYIGYAKLKCILQGQSVALVAAYCLLFGNEMLLTSYFPACLITLWVIVFLKPFFDKVSKLLLLWALQGFILITGIISFKFLISTLLHIADDAHIGNLLRTKLSNYKDFHTLLYVCSKEFDFIETETIIKLCMSLLLPCVFFAVIFLGRFLIKQECDRFRRRKSGGLSNKDQEEILTESKEGAEYIYHVFQTLAFTVMAVLIMRLKLFLTPQLCLMSSLLASRKVCLVFSFDSFK
ncbi:putative C-mannosyltransferase DPY19L1 [Holothuria leucospilota]|uniref:C-mannosyltransferase DPY19L1 n=1 Tax=Holothuria leucospilota TaxID=206669 RepID=A0A9Q0YSJ3_HOLLE|nr:putative C-mannosyltransferase DPY19L1 [Holothuria leucospilota]